ncbi:A24 family peptidase C-terminal domain-containing protein [Methanobacterium spitsbergense]|uniref:Prepilin peptidase n=1 Tax=Methanobacterium spitsbergense TaxID=2874285 RepID=A0A8T5UT93_9EURY|nr:A24 family peptidase C-terminal domain-containing protein [Methanobacterium spitsbergense]MBZ2165387.1 prepilin peptidase [Methanobacterium spitsbergense]
MLVTIPFISIIIALVACIYASYTDFKDGIIQNKLTFPLIAIGIILNGIYVFTTANILLFIECVIVTGIIFILGYVFWKMGAWAGGDVKLFTGLAALIPFYAIPFYSSLVSYQILGLQFPLVGTYPFPFTLIVNSILAILPFLLIYVIYIAVKTKPYLIGELLSPIKEYKKNIVLTMVVISAVTITFTLTKQLDIQIILVSLILISLLSLIISKIPNTIKAVLISIVTVYALITNLYVTSTGIVIIFISIILIEIIKKLLTSVSKEALQDDYNIEDLKEGMISTYNIYEKDNEIVIGDKSFTTRIKDALNTGDLSLINPPRGKLIISSMAAGLTQEDINLLKELNIKNKISNTLKIKKGVPFAPSILIGLLISLFFGDLAFILGKILAAIIY